MLSAVDISRERSMMEGGGLGDVEYDPDDDGEDEEYKYVDPETKESQRNQKLQYSGSARRRKFTERDSLDKIVACTMLP